MKSTSERKLPTSRGRKTTILRLDDKAESDMLFLQDNCGSPYQADPVLPSRNDVINGCIKMVAEAVRKAKANRVGFDHNELKEWLGL